MKDYMKLFITLLTLLFTIYLFYQIVGKKESGEKSNIEGFLEYITSSINNKEYGIQEDLPNPERTVDKLAFIHNFIIDFVNYLQNKYPDDVRVKRLQKRTADIVIEESEFENGVSSFTVNKGELLSVCVRSKENPENIHKNQLLLFVIIHELGHIASKSFGHNDEFNRNFKWLLDEAQNVGYTAIDYSVNPVKYCGVNVSNNPLFK